MHEYDIFKVKVIKVIHLKSNVVCAKSAWKTPHQQLTNIKL